MRKIGTHEGRDVLETTLSSGTGVEVSVIGYGAIVRDWQVPVAGALRPVVLGFERLEDYLADDAHIGAVAGRVANRIARSRFTLDGRDHVLPANFGPHHLHGGPKGIGRKVWEMERVPGEEAVKLTLSCPDGEMGYPGRLDITLIYHLIGHRLRVEFYAETDAPTPVNIVQHFYFNLMGGGDVLDHRLQAHASAYLPVDDDLIPTGEIRPVDGTPLDLRNGRTLRDEAGQPVVYDSNLVLATRRDLTSTVATVTAPDGSLTLRLWTDQPGLQVYNSGSLKTDRPGLGGRRYPRFGGLCLEDQNFPDAINHAHFPDSIVTPEHPYRHWCEIEIA
ncbi:aldose epimerase family protein [Nitratireductor sp. ZSWI3]|uniref:aldose epimerase family protein n=1 Tax=Nitratireductor sp. ZSWI3 TaxID=2966359 RepID=UPI00214F9217|nr:aldose epimerase family protein [Nitratireductor sp. ZSWI3]MCR4269013.1 galactose mutarotase [Nitratireductor sp. ZSWI3]